MVLRIYDDLSAWYPLLDPVEEHEAEADAFHQAFQRGIQGEARTLLELGSGAGNNAFFLKRHYHCTLSDLAEGMLGLSRQLNPDCIHHHADMRTLRLGTTFDAVLVHDAIVYMTTEEDLRRAFQTAFEHTRPGGAAVVAGDYYREDFRENWEVYQAGEADFELRCMEWTWDPDPNDTVYQVDYAFLARKGGELRAVHDRHFEGLFPRATWERLLQEVGFELTVFQRPIGECTTGETDQVFLCRRPVNRL